MKSLYPPIKPLTQKTKKSALDLVVTTQVGSRDQVCSFYERMGFTFVTRRVVNGRRASLPQVHLPTPPLNVPKS